MYKRGEKLRRLQKPLPTLIKEKGNFGVPNNLHHSENKKIKRLQACSEIGSDISTGKGSSGMDKFDSVIDRMAISCIHLWDMHFNQQSPEATATFLLLPGWLGWSKNGYMTWINDYPEHACVLAKFSAASMLLNPTEVWLDAPPQPQHNKNKMQLIVV
jgi:hypothetical protein